MYDRPNLMDNHTSNFVDLELDRSFQGIPIILDFGILIDILAVIYVRSTRC